MAEKMFADQLRRRGLADAVRVTSAGTGNWHVGECADERAADVLRAHGYPTDHRAAQLDDDHLAADLVVALGRNHARMLRQLGVDDDRDPDAAVVRSALGRPCPRRRRSLLRRRARTSRTVYAVIEAALPGLHDWVDEQLARNGSTLMRRLAFLLRPGWIALALVVIAFTYLCFTVLAPWQLGKNTRTSRENRQIEYSLNTAAGAAENAAAAAEFVGSRLRSGAR